MSTLLKIHNGTVQGDVHICGYCSNGAIRIEDNRQIVQCSNFGRIRGRVTVCSSFRHINDDSLGMYKECAWLLYRDERDQPYFVSPGEREQDYRGHRRRRRNPSSRVRVHVHIRNPKRKPKAKPAAKTVVN